MAILPTMDKAPTEPSLLDADPRPSATANEAASGSSADTTGVMRGCPFLVAEEGGWRLDIPSRAHRCGAVSPPAPLSPEKQTRLCLTAEHAACATLLASLAARGERLGPLAPASERTTRWGFARTTTVIEEAGGLRARVLGFLLDRGRWPAIPAVILVLTLLVLAASGLRPSSPAAVESTPTPGPTAQAAQPTGAATPAPTEASTPAPTGTPSSPPPSAAPSARPTATPSVAFTTYKVRSGDTLSGLASRFHTTSRAIADLNGISVTSTLHIGQVLKIPTG